MLPGVPDQSTGQPMQQSSNNEHLQQVAPNQHLAQAQLQQLQPHVMPLKKVAMISEPGFYARVKAS